MVLMALEKECNMPLLFEELHVEILSWLPVKSLVKFRCVSTTWKSIISDSQFVKLHLHRSSSKNTAYLLIRDFVWHDRICDQEYIAYPSMSSLLEKHSAMVATPSFLHLHGFIGSCNGLIALIKGELENATRNYFSQVCFWNPVTRSKSQQYSPRLYEEFGFGSNFGFGYDCSSDTYKVVAASLIRETTVNVYNIGDNCWRRIQVSPLPSMNLKGEEAIHVNNTLNWLTRVRINHTHVDNELIINIVPLTIISFDLGKEELTQLSLPYCPRKIDEYRRMCFGLGVLRGFLSISQNDRKTHNFVVWQMKEFGVHKSWTQIFNIICCPKIIAGSCFAICMSESGDALVLGRYSESKTGQAALYTKSDNKLEGLTVSNHFHGSQVKNYIESLVSPY